jgi:membrane associated rhomboid family serine protease
MTEFRPGRFEILPLIIKNLLIINVLVFIAQQTFGSGRIFSMEDLFALHHVKSPLFQPWQLITHLFLHGSFTHLLFNMFSLWMFGSVLESLWGPKRYLTFYFICGLGAAILQLAFLWYESRGLLSDFLAFRSSPSPQALMSFFNHYGSSVREQASVDAFNAYLSSPANDVYKQNAVTALNGEVNGMISQATLGASGAVSGILAGFTYLFPNTYLYLYFFVPVKAKWLGLAYFGYELYAGIANKAGDNIAHWAHLGGALVGLLLVLTWNKTNKKTFY